MPDEWEVADRFNHRSATGTAWTTVTWNNTWANDYTYAATTSTTTNYTINTPMNWGVTYTNEVALQNYWHHVTDRIARETDGVMLYGPGGPPPVDPVVAQRRQVEREAARAAEARRDEHLNRQRAARDEARRAARARANELLLSLLSPDQVADYVDNEAFEVVGSAGGRYRILKGVTGNVAWLDADGEVAGRLCAHPTMDAGWMPDQDVAIAQLLALTTDEPGFVRLANVHWGRAPEMLGAA